LDARCQLCPLRGGSEIVPEETRDTSLVLAKQGHPKIEFVQRSNSS
jgi:hypothetical protein